MTLAGPKTWLRPKALPIIGLVGLCVIVGFLGLFLVQAATKKLLEAEARIDAERWSNYLSANIKDLSGIAGGSLSTLQTRDLSSQIMTGGHVVAFRLYDASGRLKLQSHNGNGTPAGTTVNQIAPGISEAFARGDAVTMLHQGEIAGSPAFLATTIVPVRSGVRTAGWLLLEIDQTERQRLFSTVTAQYSLAICILLIAGPVFGFWYHARSRARLEQAIDTLSNLDQLTGFVLKSGLMARIDQQLDQPDPAGKRSALIVCEMSGANDLARNFGRAAEEQAVKIASERLAHITAGKASVASAGRGSFLIYLDSVADPMDALSLAKEITLALSAEIVHDGLRLSCQSHSGIALTPSDGKTAAELLRNAELALIAAREQGNPGYGFFNPELAKDSTRRLAVQRAVATATEQRAFRLDFQPVYNIRNGELNGFEALIRLHDADLGPVSPAEFIPVAEDMGLINQIGAWALDEACRVAAQWPSHLMVAVNLSPSQFLSGTLISDVRKALEGNAFPSYRLEVEITEGTLMNDSELVLRQLRVLRDMGVAVALDDFGTGYSSLSYLWKFPFSKLKIDRSFVTALDQTASARASSAPSSSWAMASASR